LRLALERQAAALFYRERRRLGPGLERRTLLAQSTVWPRYPPLAREGVCRDTLEVPAGRRAPAGSDGHSVVARVGRRWRRRDSLPQRPRAVHPPQGRGLERAVCIGARRLSGDAAMKTRPASMESASTTTHDSFDSSRLLTVAEVAAY